jgi:hypothetical protein
MQWKWGEHHRYHILCNVKGGEHQRYHILCNGKRVEHHRYHISCTGTGGENNRYHMLCNGNEVEIMNDIFYAIKYDIDDVHPFSITQNMISMMFTPFPLHKI